MTFLLLFYKEPPGQLSIFDLRYQGQSVLMLIVSTDDVCKNTEFIDFKYQNQWDQTIVTPF